MKCSMPTSPRPSPPTPLRYVGGEGEAVVAAGRCVVANLGGLAGLRPGQIIMLPRLEGFGQPQVLRFGGPLEYA
jgi:hypothetical protein